MKRQVDNEEITQEIRILEIITNYKVYAKINDKKQVERFLSTCFESPQENDVLIKTGSGDEFVHVGYYQVYDENMCHNYKIENGELVECTEEEKQIELEEREKNRPLSENEILQKQIADLEIQVLDYTN